MEPEHILLYGPLSFSSKGLLVGRRGCSTTSDLETVQPGCLEVGSLAGFSRKAPDTSRYRRMEGCLELPGKPRPKTKGHFPKVAHSGLKVTHIQLEATGFPRYSNIPNEPPGYGHCSLSSTPTAPNSLKACHGRSRCSWRQPEVLPSSPFVSGASRFFSATTAWGLSSYIIIGNNQYDQYKLRVKTNGVAVQTSS